MNPKKVIIFDLDGHLHDSEKGFYKIFCGLLPETRAKVAYRKKFGRLKGGRYIAGMKRSRTRDAVFQENFKNLFVEGNCYEGDGEGKGMRFYVENLMGVSLSGERHKRYNEFFKPRDKFTEREVRAIDVLSNQKGAAMDTDMMFAFLPEMLAFYQDNSDCKLYILSSGQSFRIAANIKAYGLENVFKSGANGNVVCNGDSPFKLTNKVEALEEIARREGVDTVYFSGDGQSDEDCAVKANARGKVKVEFTRSVYATNMQFVKDDLIAKMAPEDVAISVIDLFAKQNRKIAADMPKEERRKFVNCGLSVVGSFIVNRQNEK